MPDRRFPTFGNLVVIERDAAIELRLNTNTGSAVFTHREIAGLIAHLSQIEPKPADPVEPFADLLG